MSNGNGPIAIKYRLEPLCERGVLEMLSRRQRASKRTFDVCVALVGLLLFGWLIVLAVLLARLDTGESGIFCQTRVGRFGRRFSILKIRTMRSRPDIATSVTTTHDPRITWLGSLLRKTKIDELPQLVNVLKGDMSFVGPRPDVPEIADRLCREAPLVLTMRPGITGPASLKYRNEEQLLGLHSDSEWVNTTVIFPDKMRINTAYVENYRVLSDFKYIWQTITGKGDIASATEIVHRIADERQAA